MDLVIEIILVLGGVLLYVFLTRRPYLTTKVGAPYVPLEPEIVEEVMKLAELKESDIFYDLGSGDGRLVIAAGLRGVKKAYGIEIDSWRNFYSRLWLKLLRLKNAEIIKNNLFEVDLSEATVVSFYLLPETNDKLKAKLEKELRKGTRVIAVAFPVEDWEPIKIDPKGPSYGPIYLYQI